MEDRAEEFWEREPERRLSRRKLFWALIVLLLLALGAVTDLPGRLTFT